MVDFIRPTPRNPFLGLLADAATKARDATGVVGDFLLGGAPQTLDNASYGVPPVRFGETRNGLMGAVNGMQVDPGAADIAGLLSGVPGVVRGGQFVGREALRAVDDAMMGGGRGLLSAARPQFMVDQAAYRGAHRAPSAVNGVPLRDVRGSGVVPDDFWAHPDWYVDKTTEGDSFDAMRKMLGAMDAAKGAGADPGGVTVTIYRAVPKGVQDSGIQTGDWVTLSPVYARMHGESLDGGYQVLSQKVPARDLYWDGNSVAELGYAPQQQVKP